MLRGLPLVLFSSAVLATPLGAQTRGNIPTVTLNRPTAAYAEPFSQVAGLRELSDGRILLADRLELTVQLIDLGRGTSQEIGRHGQGPGEYGMPGWLLPLGGDTTLMVDMANMRGMVILPNGRVGETISFQQPPSTGPGGAMIRAPMIPRGSDAQGRLYVQRASTMGPGMPPSDSAALLRWDPRTERVDTIAKLHVPTPNIQVGFGAGAGARMGPVGGAAAGRRQAFTPNDGWAVTRDGKVAVARAGGYRVEWIDGQGRRTRGSETPYTPVRVTQADKEAWADQQAQGIVSMRTPQGTRTERAPRPNLADVDFPEHMPPFPSQGVWATPEGELWIQLSKPARNRNTTYDVFDGSGQLVRRVTLTDGRRIAGFGRGTVYTIRPDEDDLQWLERFTR